MIIKPAEIIHPPYLKTETDNRRWEFDFKNEQIVTYSHKVDILFIGDSITHLWELNANFRKFGYVVNRGISGDRVNHLSQRFMGDAVQLKPRLTVLMIGVNNTWEACDGSMTSDEVHDLFEEHYRKILTMAKENNMKILPCSVMPARCNSPLQDKLIQRMDVTLQALCKEFGFEYVDYYTQMVAEDGYTYPEMYSTDGLHPNAIGYNKMVQILMPYLERYLQAE